MKRPLRHPGFTSLTPAAPLAALAMALAACGGSSGSGPSGPTGPTGPTGPGGTLGLSAPCTAPTQGAAYSCTLTASGGTAPYTFSVAAVEERAQLPEGLALDASTGVVSSARVGGQGGYVVRFQVADRAGHTGSRDVTFAIAGSNAFLASIFPASSIFHHRVDAATTGLPVDTSPAAPMYSGYLSATLRVFFGAAAYQGLPNGIPAIDVPADQAMVPAGEDPDESEHYQFYFRSGPLPPYAPVEGTALSAAGDRHVLVYRRAGAGHGPSLWEMWKGRYAGAGGWLASSDVVWQDVSTNALTPQERGTSDAAGLPIAPLLLNADEVIGTGTPAAPNGAVQHPVRFTLNHILNKWVWPGTQTAGQGACDGSYDSARISQSSPPASCTFTGPAGQIYRLKASAADPACAATSPQARIIITGFRNYGIILSDNGSSGGLIGTPDARWNDDDLACLRSITLGQFEPVNVSSLMKDPESGETAR